MAIWNSAQYSTSTQSALGAQRSNRILISYFVRAMEPRNSRTSQRKGTTKNCWQKSSDCQSKFIHCYQQMVSFLQSMCVCDYQMRPLYSSLRLNTVLQAHSLISSSKSASDDNSLRIHASDRMYSIIFVNPSLDILFLSTKYLLRQGENYRTRLYLRYLAAEIMCILHCISHIIDSNIGSHSAFACGYIQLYPLFVRYKSILNNNYSYQQLSPCTKLLPFSLNSKPKILAFTFHI